MCAVGGDQSNDAAVETLLDSHLIVLCRYQPSKINSKVIITTKDKFHFNYHLFKYLNIFI